ncbi:CapA family protein [Cytobacillus depressus]|uniref:CapA family protein n=1 Tax=Cytobacillus depressus TaxID=1602942 RepID=A0A6L3VA96_9BACI|nr:CapA family protein [Cytobacillus depressus]KAB2338601.1 CapA family protein [Cytobacillus depressus]
MKDTISFVATGDYLQTRRVPSYQEENFMKIRDIVKSADARITNLEISIVCNEGIPGAISGGTHVKTTPDRLDDLKEYGFNLVGTANNHAFDYNYEGLEATNCYLDRAGILHTGTGENLYEAGKPAFLDTIAGRVAFISVSVVSHLTHMATEQRHNIKGRPGINGLRHVRRHIISKEEMTVLKGIAEKTEINAFTQMAINEAFILPFPENILPFGNDQYGYPMLFEVGNKEGLVTETNEKDMKRIERLIDDSRRQADYVVVNFHAHEMKGVNKREAADFVKIAARRFIDAGAHAIIGHGPHTIRGIEIYNNKPIFHGLGNFIFQNETLDVLPQDFYDKHNIPNEYGVMQAMDMKTKGGTKGLLSIPEMMESILPTWTMRNGELEEITIYPIDLDYGKKRHQTGFPYISNNIGTLKRLQELSEPFGTKISIENGIGKIYCNSILKTSC